MYHNFKYYISFNIIMLQYSMYKLISITDMYIYFHNWSILSYIRHKNINFHLCLPYNNQSNIKGIKMLN